MFRLTKLFVAIVSLLMLNFSFAEQPVGDNNVDEQRSYKEYCSSGLTQSMSGYGDFTGNFLVDLYINNDSPEWKKASRKKGLKKKKRKRNASRQKSFEKKKLKRNWRERLAIFTLKNVDRRGASEMCKSKCDKYDGVGKKKLNRCIGYYLSPWGKKEEWECVLAREVILSSKVTDTNPEKLCEASLYIDTSSAQILQPPNHYDSNKQSSNRFNRNKYFAVKNEHEEYIRSLNRPIGKMFRVPDTINFDLANKELFCDEENPQCREDLQKFLELPAGGGCDEKVYHLLDLKSNERVSCEHCVRTSMGSVILLAHRIGDYMTEYYKTGKKLFVNGACLNEDGR